MYTVKRYDRVLLKTLLPYTQAQQIKATTSWLHGIIDKLDAYLW